MGHLGNLGVLGILGNLGVLNNWGKVRHVLAYLIRYVTMLIVSEICY